MAGTGDDTLASVPRLKAELRQAKSGLAVLLGMLPEKWRPFSAGLSRPLPFLPTYPSVFRPNC